MTLRQWNQFLAVCKATDAWARLKAQKGYVNLFDLNEHFVKPWTRGTGCSIALRMNSGAPVAAQLMISHSWAEDVEECAQALNGFCCREGLTEDAAVWFCLFAQYQPGDEAGDPGPTVAEQLQRDPFGCVVRYVCDHNGMVVIHTTRAEVYDRLWCVKEISEALRIGCPTKPACSLSYVESTRGRLVDIAKVHTRRARCSVRGDEARIRAEVRLTGGFRRLDREILSFRIDMLRSLAEERARKREEGDLPCAVQAEFQHAEMELQRLSHIIFVRRVALAVLAVVFVVFVGAVVIIGIEERRMNAGSGEPLEQPPEASPPPDDFPGFRRPGGAATPSPTPSRTKEIHHHMWHALVYICPAAAAFVLSVIASLHVLGRQRHGKGSHLCFLQEQIRMVKERHASASQLGAQRIGAQSVESLEVQDYCENGSWELNLDVESGEGGLPQVQEVASGESRLSSEAQ